MPLSDFLKPEGVIPVLRANSKKQALLELAEHASTASGLSERDIFETLLQRERLGSDRDRPRHRHSARQARQGGALFWLFARLERPIDFEALDSEPVDLLFLLIAPESAGADHLKALARVARVLRDPGVTQKLRATHDPAALYAILTETPTSHAAA